MKAGLVASRGATGVRYCRRQLHGKKNVRYFKDVFGKQGNAEKTKGFPLNLAPMRLVNRQLSLEIKGGFLGNKGKMDIYKGLVPDSKEITCLLSTFP